MRKNELKHPAIDGEQFMQFRADGEPYGTRYPISLYHTVVQNAMVLSGATPSEFKEFVNIVSPPAVSIRRFTFGYIITYEMEHMVNIMRSSSGERGQIWLSIPMKQFHVPLGDEFLQFTDHTNTRMSIIHINSKLADDGEPRLTEDEIKYIVSHGDLNHVTQMSKPSQLTDEMALVSLISGVHAPTQEQPARKIAANVLGTYLMVGVDGEHLETVDMVEFARNEPCYSNELHAQNIVERIFEKRELQPLTAHELAMVGKVPVAPSWSELAALRNLPSTEPRRFGVAIQPCYEQGGVVTKPVTVSLDGIEIASFTVRCLLPAAIPTAFHIDPWIVHVSLYKIDMRYFRTTPSKDATVSDILSSHQVMADYVNSALKHIGAPMMSSVEANDLFERIQRVNASVMASLH